MTTARARRVYLCPALVLLLVLVMAYTAVPALADTWNRANADGFGDSGNTYLDSMAKFGSYLYAGTSGAQLFRSLNGTSWSPVTTNGFGDPNNGDMASMAVFQNRLYVGTSNFTTGCQVWEYNGTTWHERVNDGFGFADPNQSVTSMTVFGDYLYAGCGAEGWCQLWRTNDGTTWSQVVGGAVPPDPGPGFGDFTNNSIMSMAVFEGRLYAGTYNASTGAEVWKSTDGATWEKSNADGFYGGNKNTQATSLIVFGGRLYAGTFNASGGEVWRTSDGTDWNRVVKNGFETGDHAALSLAVFNDELYAGTWNCKVFRSSNGTTWTQANTSKFDDNYNVEIHCMSEFEDRLYAGTGNFSTGCELWRTAGVSPTVSPTISSISPTSGPPGTSVTITGHDFGDTRGAGGGTSQVTGMGRSEKAASYVSFNGAVATAYTKWSDTEIICTVPDGASPGPIYVVVNGQSSNKNKTFIVSSPIWYLAEGTTAWGFSTYISIENPNISAVHAAITYQTTNGPVSGGTVNLPAKSQATVNPVDKLGSQDFSTKVVCKEGKTIAVDRTMSWTGPGAASPEAHSSIGVTSPNKTWYLAEGSTAWGFECWLLIQNPNNKEASCDVTYMIEGAGPKTVNHKVPANSRKTFNVAEDIGAHDASIKVDSTIPVIPERAMYRNSRREGHDSIGTASPAKDYYLAEGTTAWGFTTYVLVQNPNDNENKVTVTYMTTSGPKPQSPITMPANSRKTIKVNDMPEVASTDLSTAVHGTLPLIAERAMYWGAGTPLGEATHDSIGMAAPHTTFYLPDGETSNGRETWTLVQNPNTTNVTVEITYMTPTGKGNVVKTEKIPANSRRTFSMAEHSRIQGRASIMVQSKTSGKKIMVERAMYWNSRGAGTDTIGGYSD